MFLKDARRLKNVKPSDVRKYWQLNIKDFHLKKKPCKTVRRTHQKD